MLADDLNDGPQQGSLMSSHLWHRVLSALKSPEVVLVAAYVSEGLTPTVTEAEKL